LITGGIEDAEIHLALGHTRKTVGDSEAAITSYRQAISCRGNFGEAYWSLANLKTYRFIDAEIHEMRRVLARSDIAPTDLYHLHFALGKAFEDRGEFLNSYEHYVRGNELKHQSSRYRAESIEELTSVQARVCDAAFFSARKGWGHTAPDPIFIVGLPRSGSTLLEQILASHSQVEGTHELPNVQQLIRSLLGFETVQKPGYPELLTTLTEADFRRLGDQYLEDTRVYRGSKPYFIDKMPNNFRHIGLIHLMFPNARIIDARREPMACCFSNFKQLFADGQEFTYSLVDIARYYRAYLQVMQHWDTALPGRILHVHYEDVVEDFENVVRRLLAHCDLAFEAQCVFFHTTRRSVRTPSSEQVRQAIYRDGLEQWRHFEPWLAPLRETLGDAVCGYRD